jgi:hypothetical protein
LAGRSVDASSSSVQIIENYEQNASAPKPVTEEELKERKRKEIAERYL